MSISIPQTAAIGLQVSEITGEAKAGAQAAGIAAWIQSVTGQAPGIVRLDGDRVRLVMDDSQQRKMQAWLDAQLYKGFTSREPATVETNLSEAFTPWVTKYAVPAVVAVFIAGYLTSRVINR